MGRQIPVAMNNADEAEFLQYLHATADIQLFLGRASAPEQLPTLSFESGLGEFLIHNRAYPWNPQLERIGDLYYRYNDGDAPLVQYSRHPLKAPNPQVSGRLYWSKHFGASAQALRYDVAAFDRWFTSLTRWVRKRGVRREHGSTVAWFLPGAYRQVSHVP